MPTSMPIHFTVIRTLLLGMIAAYFSLPEYFGAHPIWAQTVVVIGAPIGIILGTALWALKLGQRSRVIIGFIALAGAFGIAYYGKTAFANSYAEDQFAGKLWYIGWIATSAATALLIMASARKR